MCAHTCTTNFCDDLLVSCYLTRSSFCAIILVYLVGIYTLYIYVCVFVCIRVYVCAALIRCRAFIHCTLTLCSVLSDLLNICINSPNSHGCGIIAICVVLFERHSTWCTSLQQRFGSSSSSLYRQMGRTPSR
jgi:hypothetical protein